MYEITNIALTSLYIVLAISAGYTVFYIARKLFTGKDISSLIETTVAAAEQLLKSTDPDGTRRFDFVLSVLKKAGYVITSELKVLIEAAVYRLNQSQRK